MDPDRDAVTRVISGLLHEHAEQHDEWAEELRYPGLDLITRCRAVPNTTTAPRPWHLRYLSAAERAAIADCTEGEGRRAGDRGGDRR